jgi:2-hydroxychromene-2-carboxylate isomerase
MRQLDFFYFFGSVYAGLSVLRIRRLADAAGISIRWRPFNVRPLMQENNVALRTEARKIQYMWRDVERRTALHGLSYVKPPVWPTDPELLHNKVGMLAADEGWIEPFTVASIKAWFLEGMPLGDEACLSHVLEQLGKDPAATISAASGERIAGLYAANTDEARRHGIFGSPSFVTEDGNMFWGDDRLEEAIAWAAGTHPLKAAKPNGA